VQTATPLFSSLEQNPAGAQPARFLPTSRAEMDVLGWDHCDIIIVTGDAYVDHPSFGMAIIGRVLEAQGFKVGIIAQPDWHSTRDFEALGKPRLFFGVTGGQHGFHGESLHLGSPGAQRRLPIRPEGRAASARIAASSSIRSEFASPTNPCPS